MLALAPAVVAFPIVLVLTFFLCVGIRRAVAFALAGAVPLAAIALWLDTGGSHGTCGTSCLGRQDAAPVAWWLVLAWVLAVAGGTLLGVWRDRVAARAMRSRATAAARGA
ncbi:MAG: hypothetical protein QOK36_2204 [Gaiellales bacterium]|jgi:hypothetical protein|nr:hypothetical protein [Gaiellales bacterium]